MAVDFGILAQTPSIGARYAEGLQLAQAEQERNMLRAMQIQQMDMQKKNMLAQDEERKAMAQQRAQQALKLKADMDRAARNEKLLAGLGDVLRKNGYKMDRPTLGHMAEVSLQTGDEAGAKLAMEGLRALDERDALQAAFGGQAAPAAAPSMMRQPPAAVAPSAAPTNMFAGTMADIGTTQPAPVNALAAPLQAPAAAPAAGGMSREQLQNIILNPNAPPAAVTRAKAVLASMPQAPAPAAPSEVVKLNRELTAANAAGDTALAADLKARITRLTEKPVGTQVSVKLPEQEKAFETELGKGQAKKLLDDKVAAEDASNIIRTVQQGRQLLQSGMITGFGAEALTQIGAALNQAGFNFAEDEVANTQAFTANMAQNVGRIIKQFGAGTGLSNADRDYAEKMAGGKVTLDRKAIERILDINERAARNVIALHNKNARSVKTNVPLTVDVPAGPPAPAQIPTAPAPAPVPRGASGVNIATERQNAQAAIAAGAPEAAVRKRFKDKTGQEL